MSGKRVVVAPLDWGLGHATRCIPVITELLKRGCEVWVASSGPALRLLQQEFPQLNYVELVSYRASYARRLPLMIAVFFQIPKFLKAIRSEHHQLDRIIREHNIELVISDNRYGCWSAKVTSVFITHQINILMPKGLGWLQPLVNYVNHRLIKKFDACWVPDVEGEANLTGELSKPGLSNITYIGLLSRFTATSNVRTMHDIVVVLSGPEQQRSQIESILLTQLVDWQGSVIFVRGVVEDRVCWKKEGNMSIVNYLSSIQLEEVILNAEIVIARSGYSTVMDLVRLGKKAILIPTPGQTEQEYLAARLHGMGLCVSMEQKQVNVKFAIQQAKGRIGFVNIETGNRLLEKAIHEMLGL
jgi:uncharacterized protein (TIGR00661 family)